MPTNAIKSTFSDMTESAFRVYAKAVVDAYPGAADRQRSQAYLHQIIAQDRANQDLEQRALAIKRRRRRQHQQVLEELAVNHAHDFVRAQPLFVDQVKSDAEILALLLVDDAEVFIRNRDIAGEVLLSGSNIKFHGLGTTGNAVEGTLAHTCTVTGQIKIDSDSVTIQGLRFVCPLEKAIVFTSGSNNTSVRLIDCTFESSHTYADAKFFYGQHSAGGTQLISGCRIKDFGSWYLGDATTTSADATVKLDSFTLTKCKIENCAGSFAVRGKQSGDPNGTVSFTDNLSVHGAGGIHASFWNVFEASGGLTKVIVTGNECKTMVEAASRGFFQAWSRNPIPWTLRFRNNTLSGFEAALHIACNATFYAPNSTDDDYSIRSSSGQITNTSYGASFVYPFHDATKTYLPENSSTFPNEPGTNFADSLANFVHA